MEIILIMQNYEYGITSTRPSKLKNSLIRPQSQHRSSSMSHQESIKKNSASKIDTNRHSMQISTANEYYISQGINNSRRPFRQYCKGNRSSSKLIKEQAQNIENTRKFFIQQLQRWTIDLRDQIHKQSSQIFNLEKLIEQQNREIQSKNTLIKALVAKLQKKQIQKDISNEKQSSMNLRRIQDLQAKLSILIGQMQEQKQEMNNKIQNLTCGIIRYFGKQVWKLKGRVFQFIKGKQKNFEEIGKQVNTLYIDIELKIMGMQKNIENIQTGVKIMTDDSFSKGNSKDTLSLGSHKSDVVQLFKKQDSLFSDYFFYPPEKQMTNIKTIELLVKEREELPIRVFIDLSGRLKYWQSRTFIFDRKGNFTTPTSGQIAVMQQRGWIKIISND